MNTTVNPNPDGRTDMNLIHENLARARRLSRKAERAAQQARLALARAL